LTYLNVLQVNLLPKGEPLPWTLKKKTVSKAIKTGSKPKEREEEGKGDICCPDTPVFTWTEWFFSLGSVEFGEGILEGKGGRVD